MKRCIIFLLIAALGIPGFAQENWRGNRRAAITVNPTPLAAGLLLGGFGLEAGFEFAPARSAGIKINALGVGLDPFKTLDMDLAGGAINEEIDIDTNIFMARASVEGRWYPAGNYLHGFFLNGGLQYHLLGAYISLESSDNISVAGGAGMSTLGVFGGLGYKAIFGSRRAGFVLEPALDFVWPLHSQIPFGGMNNAASNVIGWMLGIKMIRFRLQFGVAF